MHCHQSYTVTFTIFQVIPKYNIMYTVPIIYCKLVFMSSSTNVFLIKFKHLHNSYFWFLFTSLRRKRSVSISNHITIIKRKKLKEISEKRIWIKSLLQVFKLQVQREGYVWVHSPNNICKTRKNAKIHPSSPAGIQEMPGLPEGIHKAIPISWTAICLGISTKTHKKETRLRQCWKLHFGATVFSLQTMSQSTVLQKCLRADGLSSSTVVILLVSQDLRVWSYCQGDSYVNQSLAGTGVRQDSGELLPVICSSEQPGFLYFYFWGVAVLICSAHCKRNFTFSHWN